jgi:hypothetical protein
VDTKAWYDTVFRIATAVVPAAIQAAQSKDFTPGAPALPPADVDAKAWYDTVFRIATAVVPAAIQAVQSKGLYARCARSAADRGGCQGLV